MLDLLLLGGRRRFLDGRADVAAAFSLRRLRSGHGGPLVRVRRSSDSAEADFGVGQGGVSWGAVLSFIGAGSGFVAKWYDQSGNGRDLSQSTAANQPQVILAANGLPALLFDGSNDVMQTSAFTLNQPHSRNIAYRLVAVPGAEADILDGGTSNRGVLFYTTATGRTQIYAGTSAGTDATAMPLGQRGAVGMTFNGASSILELNGATVVSQTGLSASTNNPGGMTVGANGDGTVAANVELHELIQFNAAHSSGQLQIDNAAMRRDWNF